MGWVEREPFRPTYLPPELQKVWEKHNAEKERCWREWQEGCSMRHEKLYHKHEAVCDALESIGQREKDHAELAKLKERVRDLPSEEGYYKMRDAILALKHDMALGKL